ncbi:transposable element Tcb2 transposase [Trichonephila clavipes]|nr:transposable element Tcb2 transposase [Trichonephila clavipes]
MDWPAHSPDLYPIEHVWDALGRRIAARLHHPENTQQLKKMLIEEWTLLPQEMLHQLVLTNLSISTAKPNKRSFIFPVPSKSAQGCCSQSLASMPHHGRRVFLGGMGEVRRECILVGPSKA